MAPNRPYQDRAAIDKRLVIDLDGDEPMRIVPQRESFPCFAIPYCYVAFDRNTLLGHVVCARYSTSLTLPESFLSCQKHIDIQIYH